MASQDIACGFSYHDALLGIGILYIPMCLHSQWKSILGLWVLKIDRTHAENTQGVMLFTRTI